MPLTLRRLINPWNLVNAHKTQTKLGIFKQTLKVYHCYFCVFCVYGKVEMTRIATKYVTHHLYLQMLLVNIVNKPNISWSHKNISFTTNFKLCLIKIFEKFVGRDGIRLQYFKEKFSGILAGTKNWKQRKLLDYEFVIPCALPHFSIN